MDKKNINNKKYFNHSKKRVLDLDQDIVDYYNWLQHPLNKVGGYHEDGFLVFLKPENITQVDEYINGDPFGMEDNLSSEFQKSRIKLTLDFLSLIINNDDNVNRILDIGCGQGHITSKIKEYFPKAEITGIDTSLTAICYANKHYEGIDFVLGNAYDFPFSKDYFDIAICNNTWEHITDPVLMSKGLCKILKNNGSFILSTPSRYRIMNLIKGMLGKNILINSNHITEYSVGQVKEQLNFASFKVSKVKGVHVKGQGGSFFTKVIIHKLIKPLSKGFLALVGSHHILESTVFFLAKKIEKS